VDDLQRAIFGLGYPEAQNMDAGERDLFAHAYGRAAGGDDVWILCSADKAAVRAAVALGWQDRLQSLGGLVAAVGAREHAARGSLRRALAVGLPDRVPPRPLIDRIPGRRRPPLPIVHRARPVVSR
jgi:hypothetical protein